MPCIYISKNFLVLSGCLPFLESRVWTSQSVMSSCRGTQCTIVTGWKPQANNSRLEMTQTASWCVPDHASSPRPFLSPASLFYLSSFPGHWDQLPLLTPLLHLRMAGSSQSAEGDSSKEQPWKPKTQSWNKSQTRTSDRQFLLKPRAGVKYP